jgi:hypothetical protein
MADHEPRTDVACGEPAVSDQLRDALTLLRDRSDDDEFRLLADDVLAGRRSLFDAASTAAFGRAVFAPVARDVEARFGHLTPDERREAAAQDGSESAAGCAEPHHRTLGDETGTARGPCGSPCSTCTSICGLAGVGPST